MLICRAVKPLMKCWYKKFFWVGIFSIFSIFLFKPIRSLSSLRKLDDYPLFILDYYENDITELWIQSTMGESFLENKDISVMRSDSSSAFATANIEGYAILGRNQEFWRPYQKPVLLLVMHPANGYKSISMVSLDLLELENGRLSLMDYFLLMKTPYLIQDGMNEHGLGVSITAAPCRIGSPSENIQTIDSSFAMRLILNEARSVDEAIEILDKFNIYFRDICGHHLIADAHGNTAIVEYIDGDMVIHRNQNPWQVTTNFLVAEYQPVDAEGPCWRYRKAAEMLENHQGKISTEIAMQILESISTRTVWSVVYNLTTGTIDLSLGRNYELLYTLNLDMQFKPGPWFEIQHARLSQE